MENGLGAALLIGSGDATGGAIARAFAANGLMACIRRKPIANPFTLLG